MARSDKRDGFFNYILITAVEGGINDWAFVDGYKHSIPEWYALIDPNEDDWGVEEAFISETGEVQPITETQELRIDVHVIERGWNLFMDAVLAAAKSEDPSMDFSRPYYRLAVIQYLSDMEEGDSDAEVANLVVQLGLFGEHEYS